MRPPVLAAPCRPMRRARPRLHAPDEPVAAGAQGDTQAAPGGLAPPVLRILVVDDDPLMTDLLPRKLTRALASPVAHVMTARTPEEGVRMVEESRPDVVISDYNLRSVRDGLDVLEDVRRIHPAAVRILFSAHTPEEVGPRLAEADIHGFIEKTMRLDDIVGPLFDVIRGAGIPMERAPPPGSR